MTVSISEWQVSKIIYTVSSSALKRGFGSLWDSEKDKRKSFPEERKKTQMEACCPQGSRVLATGQKIKYRPCNSDQQKMTQFM